MADEIIDQIDIAINAFTDDKTGCIRRFQRITDDASNKEHFNDTYEYFNDICSDLHSLQYPIEDLVDDSISDEDADRVVTKLEELISAEKPLFDHYHACYNGSEVLVPWKNISPTAHEAPECYEPGYIDDLFEYHNSAWKQIGEHLYKVPSVQKRIYDDVLKFEDKEYTNQDLKWNP